MYGSFRYHHNRYKKKFKSGKGVDLFTEEDDVECNIPDELNWELWGVMKFLAESKEKRT